MNSIDLAYAAGLFDGEGCISFSRRSRISGGYRYSLSVSVEMSDEQSIDFLVKTFGGSKMFYDRQGKKRLYRWSKSSLTDVVEFLEHILPYAKYKVPQIQKALAYGYFMLGHRREFTNAGYESTIVKFQENTYDSLREMKAAAGGMR